MGLREWLKRQPSVEEAADRPPRPSLGALFQKEPDAVHALGEYTAETYPADVAELLRRRQQVSDELMRLDVLDPRARQAAIPRLKELLRIYPHALAYETLIHAYLDQRRWDEARGVAFAARERRLECSRSELPEVRAEISFLNEWSPEEVDRLQAERESRGG